MSNIRIEEQLKAIFVNVNEWLKFAETKNAALIAADGAAALAVLAVLVGNAQNLKTWFYLYLYNFVVFILLSGVAALISVIPATEILLAKLKEKTDENDNLVFYAHIAKYEPQEYLNALRSRYGATETQGGLEIDYATQIVINSRIALKKYDIFKIAIWLAIAAVVTPVLATLLFYITTPKMKAIKPSKT